MTAPAAKGQNAIGDWLVDAALRVLIGLARVLPYGLRLKFMAWAMRRLVAPVAGWTGRARAHVAMVWPELDRSQVRRVAAASLDNMGRAFIENYSPAAFRRHLGTSVLGGPGAATVQEALASGRQIVFASAHFGSYEAIRAALGARGHEIAMIYRAAANRYFQRHYGSSLVGVSGPAFFRGKKGTAGFFAHAATGAPVMLLFDVHVNRAPKLPFLSHPARTAVTAAQLALDRKALLVPCYGVRRPDGMHFDLIFEEPVPPSTPEEMTLRLNQSLEARIIEHPGQWLWVHRRWKSGPAKRHDRALSVTKLR